MSLHPSALGTTVLPPHSLLRPPRTTSTLSGVRHSLYFQKKTPRVMEVKDLLEITGPVSDKVQTRNQTCGL